MSLWFECTTSHISNVRRTYLTNLHILQPQGSLSSSETTTTAAFRVLEKSTALIWLSPLCYSSCCQSHQDIVTVLKFIISHCCPIGHFSDMLSLPFSTSSQHLYNIVVNSRPPGVRSAALLEWRPSRPPDGQFSRGPSGTIARTQPRAGI